jgi:hypothetical protein
MKSTLDRLELVFYAACGLVLIALVAAAFHLRLP